MVIRNQITKQDDSLETAPLSVNDLGVSYGDAPALWQVNYELPRQGMTAIVGPNGAGKSTFLRACLGLVPVMSGQVRYFGKPLSANRQRVSYMPQRSSLDWEFPASVLDVATMGRYRKLGWLRPVSRHDRNLGMEALERVGLQDLADRPIGQLSGGQQQRTLLARALTQEADLYFMDEPFAGVDAATEDAILDVLQQMSDQGKSVVCVHHDLQTVAERFDNLLLLNAVKIADGSVEQTLTLDNLERAYGGRLQGIESIAIDAAA